MIKSLIIAFGVSCLAGAACAQSATEPESICAAKGLAAGSQPYTDCVTDARYQMNKSFADNYVVVQGKLRSQIASGSASPEQFCSASGYQTGSTDFDTCVNQTRQSMSSQASSTYSQEMQNAQMNSSPTGPNVAH